MSRDDGQIRPADVAVAVSGGVLDAAAAAGRRLGGLLGPLVRSALDPAPVPQPLRPVTLLGELGRVGEARRAALREELSRRLDQVVPVVLDLVLRRVQLTDVVLENVDLQRVVSAVDLDAAVSRVDLDAAVSRVDVDAVARRLDLDAVLDRLDLTALVLLRVDLDEILGAVLARLDLVGLAAEVIDGVDLPEIIRDSTGSIASDAVRGIRMQGISADQAVGRAVDRLLLRRGGRTADPVNAEDATGSPVPAVPAAPRGHLPAPR